MDTVVVHTVAVRRTNDSGEVAARKRRAAKYRPKIATSAIQTAAIYTPSGPKIEPPYSPTLAAASAATPTGPNQRTPATNWRRSAVPEAKKRVTSARRSPSRPQVAKPTIRPSTTTAVIRPSTKIPRALSGTRVNRKSWKPGVAVGPSPPSPASGASPAPGSMNPTTAREINWAATVVTRKKVPIRTMSRLTRPDAPEDASAEMRLKKTSGTATSVSSRMKMSPRKAVRVALSPKTRPATTPTPMPSSIRLPSDGRRRATVIFE